MVIVGQTKLLDSFLAREVELLVNFVLNGDPMCVPAKASLNVMALHGPVSGDDIFDGRGEEVSVVRQAGSERRAIVEGVSRLIFGQLDLDCQTHQQRSFSGMCEHVCTLTWRSKALISRHFSMTATSALGKSMDIVR